MVDLVLNHGSKKVNGLKTLLTIKEKGKIFILYLDKNQKLIML